MVRVRFLGLTRLLVKESRTEIDAERVDELLKKISEQYEDIEFKKLKNCVIFVNGTNIVYLKIFRTKLKDGDEVQILSPAGGG